MLTYNELNRISSFKNLSLINAEKDYLQDLILFSIYSKIGKDLVFKGGTALYKLYSLNRFSGDLDFTLINGIDIKKIAMRIINDLKLLNIKGSLKEIKEYGNQKNVRLIFKGPLYKGDKESQCFIPLNISLRGGVILEPRRELIHSMYKEIRDFYVFSIDEKELLAEKLVAILNRDKPRDVYDFWFLLKRGVNLDMKIIDKKLKFYDINFVYDKFINSIRNKKTLWEIDLKNLIIGELPKFENVIKEIEDCLNK